MKRLTTDNPDGNIETMLNYVYGKDGWAHIRHDGEHEDVNLTDWAKRQCKLQGCDEVWTETPEKIDERLCDCMMDGPICPIAMAYCFASQAVHMRTRLKRYEDVLFDEVGKELLPLDDLRKLAVSNDPLTLKELRGMEDIPVWVVGGNDAYIDANGYGVVNFYECYPDRACIFWPGDEVEATPRVEDYGKTWLAYRRRPEEDRHA